MPRGNDILTDSDADRKIQSNVSNTPGLPAAGGCPPDLPGFEGGRYPWTYLLSMISCWSDWPLMGDADVGDAVLRDQADRLGRIFRVLAQAWLHLCCWMPQVVAVWSSPMPVTQKALYPSTNAVVDDRRRRPELTTNGEQVHGRPPQLNCCLGDRRLAAATQGRPTRRCGRDLLEQLQVGVAADGEVPGELVDLAGDVGQPGGDHGLGSGLRACSRCRWRGCRARSRRPPTYMPRIALSVNITPPGTSPLNTVFATRKWAMPAQVQSPTPVKKRWQGGARGGRGRWRTLARP